MKSKSRSDADDMRPEYDFDYSKGVRGKYYRRILAEGMTFPLDDPGIVASLRRLGYGRKRLTAVVKPDGNGFVSLCPELDITSQGDTLGEAQANLLEALRLFSETASPQEVESRIAKQQSPGRDL